MYRDGSGKGNFKIAKETNLKILWICNVPIPEAKDVMGDETEVRVSWLVGISRALREQVDLYIGYFSADHKEITVGRGNQVTFVAIPRKKSNAVRFDPLLEDELVKVYEQIKPDVIHVFGTEFPHALSAVNASCKTGRQEHTVVSIQGLVSMCARHYTGGIPEWVTHFYTIRDIIRHTNIRGVQKNFEKRGTYEIEALSKYRHVIGRTDLDKACVKMYHPDIVYHFNNEILRPLFYQKNWEYESCTPHRIFMSQGGFPYKGFHRMVEALAILKRRYPDVSLYITERDFVNASGIKEKLRLNSYQYYVRKLIKRNHLEENIHFLGTLNEEEMCDQYLKANVFVQPSAIENSPNSLGEAMLLGTPVVVADVGGVKNMIRHEEEGFLYQHDAPYMIAYYVEQYFEMKSGAVHMTARAKEHAQQIFDVQKNISDLLAIYEEIK
jgi:glycosyltransferase involved in cell wall biosynthesis